MESEEDEDASSGLAQDNLLNVDPAAPDEKEKGSTTTTKGKGLKKWRRIQRKDVVATPATSKQTQTPTSDDRFLKRDSRRLAPALRGSGSPSSPGGGDSDNNNSSTAASSAPPKYRFSNNSTNSNSGAEKAARAAAAGFTKEKHNFFFNGNGSYSSSSNGVGHMSFGVNTSAEHSNSYDDDDHVSAAPTSQHLLADSILSLQTVHLALQQEIRNFEEIGKECVMLSDDSTCDAKLHCASYETKSCGHVEFVKIYERKLEEAMSMVKARECRVAELEGILGREGEIEAELEDVFRRKIEAEVECLTMRKSREEPKAGVVSERENKKLVEDAEFDENQVNMLEEVSEKKKSRMMCKYGFCFFVQLMMLLFLAFRLLFSQLGPSSTTSVPT